MIIGRLPIDLLVMTMEPPSMRLCLAVFVELDAAITPIRFHASVDALDLHATTDHTRFTVRPCSCNSQWT